MIGLCFIDEVLIRDREKSLPNIFGFLVPIPADFGLNELERMDGLKGSPMSHLVVSLKAHSERYGY